MRRIIHTDIWRRLSLTVAVLALAATAPVVATVGAWASPADPVADTGPTATADDQTIGSTATSSP